MTLLTDGIIMVIIKLVPLRVIHQLNKWSDVDITTQMNDLPQLYIDI